MPPASHQHGFSAERLSFDVRKSVTRAVLTGVEPIDIEMIVACRALQRVTKRLSLVRGVSFSGETGADDEEAREGRMAPVSSGVEEGTTAPPSSPPVAARGVQLEHEKRFMPEMLTIESDIALVHAALARMAKTIRARLSSTGADPASPSQRASKASPNQATFAPSPSASPLGQASFLSAPSGEFAPGSRRLTKLAKSSLGSEEASLLRRASDGLWGIVARLAGNGLGASYELHFASQPDSATKQTAASTVVTASPVLSRYAIPRHLRAELFEEARVLGFGNLGMRLVSDEMGAPCVTLTNVSANQLASHVPIDRFWGLPLGLVDRATKSGLSVTASASSKWGRSNTEDIVRKSMTSFQTAALQGSFVTIDFFNALVLPSAYGFYSIHHIIPGCFPRSWVVSGSLDGEHWTQVHAVDQDAVLQPERQWGVWHLDDSLDSSRPNTRDAANNSPMRSRQGGPRQAFRYLRLQLTGPNSYGSHELQIHGFDVYGTMAYVEGITVRPLVLGPSSDTAVSSPPHVANGRPPRPLGQRVPPACPRNMDLDAIRKRVAGRGGAKK